LLRQWQVLMNILNFQASSLRTGTFFKSWVTISSSTGPCSMLRIKVVEVNRNCFCYGEHYLFKLRINYLFQTKTNRSWDIHTWHGNETSNVRILKIQRVWQSHINIQVSPI
jgi:hypothetical protein